MVNKPQKSGSADLALMRGHIPHWLYERMKRLCLAIVESILTEYGPQELVARLSDPFWFQSFGAVIGMDWNSSGVTTAVTRALKDAINPQAKALGLYVCGGKGKASMKTPDELRQVGDRTGLDADALARCSKLSAKVDNTAIQDGYQLYLHSFIVTQGGHWTVIQQGMKTGQRSARRYHWHSEGLTSFVDDPHTAVCGDPQGQILNLATASAQPTRGGILEIAHQTPVHTLQTLRKLTVPSHYGIKAGDVDMRRLGAVLELAQDNPAERFEDLLMLRGLGPRTLQSLTLVSEVIHGTPSRFSDPARFAFAHGSKGSRPFPIATHVYDQTIETLRKAVDMARIGEVERCKAISKLARLAERAEESVSEVPEVEAVLDTEQRNSWKHGGRTLGGFVQPPPSSPEPTPTPSPTKTLDAQTSLFD